MKFKKISLVVVLVSAVCLMAACKKNRYCHCVTTEGKADTMVVNVDRSLGCEHILELGFDRLIDGNWQLMVQKVDCVELDVDTVTTIPDRPTED